MKYVGTAPRPLPCLSHCRGSGAFLVTNGQSRRLSTLIPFCGMTRNLVTQSSLNLRVTSVALIDDVWAISAEQMSNAAVCPRCQLVSPMRQQLVSARAGPHGSLSPLVAGNAVTPTVGSPSSPRTGWLVDPRFATSVSFCRRAPAEIGGARRTLPRRGEYVSPHVEHRQDIVAPGGVRDGDDHRPFGEIQPSGGIKCIEIGPHHQLEVG